MKNKGTMNKKTLAGSRNKWNYVVKALFILLVITVLAYISLTQKSEYKADPASEKIICEIAAKELKKDPNDLTDEDFTKITFLGVSTFSATKGLADIKLLKKFTNLKLLSLENISYPQNSIPKWMFVLSKFGILNLEKRFALDLSPIRKINTLETLYIWNTPVKDLKPLANMTNLRLLSFVNAPITNFKPLENLINLKELSISGPALSNLESIRHLVHLKELHLSSRELSNLEYISELKNLEKLVFLECSNISDEQIKNLQKKLPNLKISNMRSNRNKRTNRTNNLPS